MMPYCRWPADRYVIDEVLNKRAYAKMDLGPGDRLLDLGAHVGSCVRFALNAGVEQVIAVEMLPDTLELLYQNFPPMKYEPRVVIIPAAIQAVGGPTTVVTRNFRNPMSASVSTHNNADPTGGVEVPTVSLDFLLDNFKPTKLKFDIENSEYDTILPGVDAITRSPITRIMGELHTKTEETLALAKETWHAFDQHGWTCWRHIDKFYDEPNGWHIVTGWYRDA